MKVTRVAAFAAFASVVGLAHADLVILEGPGDIPDDNNVLFNEEGLADFGNPVQGITQNPELLVDFLSDENLMTPAAGQARIEAEDGSFNNLQVFLHDGGIYTSLIVNINAITNGTVTFTVDQQSGSPLVQSFNVAGPGENFFRIFTTDTSLITKVSFTTTSEILDVRQVRIGGQSPVPEPASIAALGLGLTALVRRRRARA